jgi:CRP-like cAMP-binding protein
MSITIENVTLSRVDLFNGLSGDDLRAILPACEEVRAVAGQAVITAGQAEQALYILLDGSAEVDLEPARAGERFVADLTTGNVFGESSFFHASPHSATVKARTDSRLIKLRRDSFEKLLHGGNIAALRIAANAATILASRLQAADQFIVELLEQIQDERVREALARFRSALSHPFSGTVRPSLQVGSMQ